MADPPPYTHGMIFNIYVSFPSPALFHVLSSLCAHSSQSRSQQSPLPLIRRSASQLPSLFTLRSRLFTIFYALPRFFWGEGQLPVSVLSTSYACCWTPIASFIPLSCVIPLISQRSNFHPCVQRQKTHVRHTEKTHRNTNKTHGNTQKHAHFFSWTKTLTNLCFSIATECRLFAQFGRSQITFRHEDLSRCRHSPRPPSP
jgi:hypothetical protein